MCALGYVGIIRSTSTYLDHVVDLDIKSKPSAKMFAFSKATRV